MISFKYGLILLRYFLTNSVFLSPFTFNTIVILKIIYSHIQISLTSNHDNNKFILLLGKGVYPCEYMDG